MKKFLLTLSKKAPFIALEPADSDQVEIEALKDIIAKKDQAMIKLNRQVAHNNTLINTVRSQLTEKTQVLNSANEQLAKSVQSALSISNT